MHSVESNTPSLSNKGHRNTEIKYKYFNIVFKHTSWVNVLSYRGHTLGCNVEPDVVLASDLFWLLWRHRRHRSETLNRLSTWIRHMFWRQTAARTHTSSPPVAHRCNLRAEDTWHSALSWWINEHLNSVLCPSHVIWYEVRGRKKNFERWRSELSSSCWTRKPVI